MTSIRSRSGPVLIALATVAAFGLVGVWGAPPAEAACHIAAFEETAVVVDEGAGKAVVTVFLQGGLPQCGGAVKYRTADGTASAPADYEAKQGVICFVPNDDREQAIEIPIVDDGLDEPDESFTVHLEDATEAGCAEVGGGVSGNATADVTITDNDEVPPEPGQGTRAPTAAPVAPGAPAAPAATPTASPTPETTVFETATPEPAALAVMEPGEETGGRGGVVGVAVALVLLAAGGGFFAWRRFGRAAS